MPCPACHSHQVWLSRSLPLVEPRQRPGVSWGCNTCSWWTAGPQNGGLAYEPHARDVVSPCVMRSGKQESRFVPSRIVIDGIVTAARLEAVQERARLTDLLHNLDI